MNLIKHVRRLLAATLAATATCGLPAEAADPYQPVPYTTFENAAWTKSASLYQINLRQFSEEGTLKAAERQLPRLKALGVDILWLMPIHPIGVTRRKGSLGSPYSVRDHLAVDPAYGTLDDLKHFVGAAHAQGMHVILDWVGNHTAWDNPLTTLHPEWYTRDEAGRFRTTPWYDWEDVIELDYGKPGLRRYMTDAMKYWVRVADVDGFRADAAGLVPLDFWENASRELRAIKPVFMLAEWESRDMHASAFDATYSWTWWDAMRRITDGQADATSLYNYYAWNAKFYPRQAYRMLYTTNHDKNAWEGTEFDIFGPAVDAVTVLSFTSEGLPLIYNGQEAGNRKRLAFFERDPIEWKPWPGADLYRRLLALKKGNTALWNGAWGAPMVQVPNDAPKQIFSFVRANERDKVFVACNLSGKPQSVGFQKALYQGDYREFDSGAAVRLGPDSRLALSPWHCDVLVH